MVKGVVIGFILGLIAVAAGVWYYFGSGRAPVATTDPDMPFERTFAHRALNARLDRQPAMDSPVPADEANLLQGALAYRENCAVCHGLPAARARTSPWECIRSRPSYFAGRA